jgi:hypothetical protein
MKSCRILFVVWPCQFTQYPVDIVRDDSLVSLRQHLLLNLNTVREKKVQEMGMVGSSHYRQVVQDILDTLTKPTYHFVHDFLGSVRVGVELKLDGQLVHALENNLEREMILCLIRRQNNNFGFYSQERILNRFLRRISNTMGMKEVY